MKLFNIRLCLVALLIFANDFVNAQVAVTANTSKLPIIPVGTDAYRLWDQLPRQRIGTRAYMRSTYDRSGGNESADASHFLFMKDEDYNVTLDVMGKGALYFFRTNHWHGSPWHFVIDGKDNIVKETGTSDPVNAKKVFKETDFIPADPFPKPLAWTWGTTKGADLIWSPMAFEESLRIAYSRTRYGTGYYIYHLYANEEQLSRSLVPWDINRPMEDDIIKLINRSGSDIAPLNIPKKAGKVRLNKKRILLANIKTSSSIVRAFKVKIPIEKAVELERLQLKVTWDDMSQPSIDAPLSLFFGAGTLYNRENKEFLVKGFPINIRFDYPNNMVELACYYPMPFFKSATFELDNIDPSNTELEYEIRYEGNRTPFNLNSYFHATYYDFPNPEPGKDLVLLDTKGVEGQDHWSGSFVGTSFIFSHEGYLGTLEGDPRFFFDDSNSPQAYGTGTEEWGGGGDYWGGENMTLPFAGHPVGAKNKKEAKNDKDLIESAYRFLIADIMPFGKRAVIRLEHGGENLSTEHYETVTYWYGLPAATLILTDELDVGNITSEKSHSYSSQEASAPEIITSRFEVGIDKFPDRVWGSDASKIEDYETMRGKEVFPAHQEDGRYTRGTSEFIVKLDQKNLGVLLRRTLDYSFPNQKAEVFVANASDGSQSQWESVGIWYLAGSNTCVYSDPRGELDKRLYNVQTSNRRFRDDEFMIPARLTMGRESIRVRVKHISDETELYPNYRFPRQSAWSELRYKVYSYILPIFPTKK